MKKSGSSQVKHSRTSTSKSSSTLRKTSPAGSRAITTLQSLSNVANTVNSSKLRRIHTAVATLSTSDRQTVTSFQPVSLRAANPASLSQRLFSAAAASIVASSSANRPPTPTTRGKLQAKPLPAASTKAKRSKIPSDASYNITVKPVQTKLKGESSEQLSSIFEGMKELDPAAFARAAASGLLPPSALNSSSISTHTPTPNTTTTVKNSASESVTSTADANNIMGVSVPVVGKTAPAATSATKKDDKSHVSVAPPTGKALQAVGTSAAISAALEKITTTATVNEKDNAAIVPESNPTAKLVISTSTKSKTSAPSQEAPTTTTTTTTTNAKTTKTPASAESPLAKTPVTEATPIKPVITASSAAPAVAPPSVAIAVDKAKPVVKAVESSSTPLTEVKTPKPRGRPKGQKSATSQTQLVKSDPSQVSEVSTRTSDDSSSMSLVNGKLLIDPHDVASITRALVFAITSNLRNQHEVELEETVQKHTHQQQLLSQLLLQQQQQNDLLRKQLDAIQLVAMGGSTLSPLPSSTTDHPIDGSIGIAYDTPSTSTTTAKKTRTATTAAKKTTVTKKSHSLLGTSLLSSGRGLTSTSSHGETFRTNLLTSITTPRRMISTTTPTITMKRFSSTTTAATATSDSDSSTQSDASETNSKNKFFRSRKERRLAYEQRLAELSGDEREAFIAEGKRRQELRQQKRTTKESSDNVSTSKTLDADGNPITDERARAEAILRDKFGITFQYVNNRQLSIVNVPFAYGQPLSGVDKGPQDLLENGLHRRISDEGFKINHTTTIDVPKIDHAEVNKLQVLPDGTHKLKCPDLVSKVNHDTALATYKSSKLQNFTLTIGGDHSIAIGSIAGLLKAKPNLGVVWVDAHADINTPQTSNSGNIHGMVLSFLMKHRHSANVPEYQWLEKYPRFNTDNLVYIGLRDLDKGEKLIIRESGIKAFTMHDVDKYGIGKVMDMAVDHLTNYRRSDRPLHLSFDIDALDPHFAPATGTRVAGGLDYREAYYICEALAETGLLSSMDIVEVNSSLASGSDEALRTIKMANGLIGSALGNRIL